VLDIEQQKGRRIDASTVAWWMKQEPAARAVFLEERRFIVGHGLARFNDYLSANCVPEVDLQMWGNGSDFDNVLLAHLYTWQKDNEPIRVLRPWRFYNNRCFRTLKNICKQDYDVISKQVKRITHHDAADDARWQAEVCRRLLKKIEAARAVCDEAAVFCTDGGKAIHDLSDAVVVYEHA
jgi:hypothetical protein